ncbi:probable inositol-1(or 4)-monophosphatase / fructose-1,6-bisphosphatase, archaeal-type [Natronomonas pharaonis DSM 2160]|uniref:fructose-bisphosphatase n=1 Tax=Natronomonas pharaonis (strain ATCC 35678 / DSM 2160 / CIP 103997 / JCM 8858 / NBRC 14720 / NCIMB 2260 / Gabara) TaxID=348780 RepID=A0A1U7EY91_NATPD|nr:inositol monophosphatase [Natronomonas pharaonis]CAI50185.1 probable inositol-1(or 4)-monophosphatase / fructose-1,6-bisphosphatase, archaeal-type [Natronomonas pharaonis DSM 2160]
MDERADCARRAAEAGADIAAAAFRDGIDSETKGEKTDVVTQADRDAQRRVVGVIRERYPDEPIVGEESDGETEATADELPAEGAAWVVDPIDGTNNFVHGLREWATSVVAVVDGAAVAGATVAPALGETFLLTPDGAFLNGDPLAVSDRSDPETFTVVPTVWWGFDRRDEYAATCEAIVQQFGDMRRFGSAQLELGYCAAGAVEAVVTNIDPEPWDTVLGAALVRAAGGTVTDIHGEPWRHDSTGLVASNGRAHDAVLEAARKPERQ